MTNLLILLRKELRGFFLSPFGWIILTLVTVMQGWSMSGAMKALQDAPIPESLVYIVFHMPQFWFYFLVIFPLITMRLFAEEERAGTLETLLTAPVQTWQLVLGKYLATLCFYLILWIPAFIQFQVFGILADVPPPFSTGSLLGAFLLIFLMGTLFIAIGSFASALTSSQIIAGAVTVGLLFIHYFLGYITVIYGDRFPAASLFQHISSSEHLRYFSKGLIDSRTIIYYLTAATFFLFLTHHVLNHRRWRS
ncbi:MAG: hypothetical protein CMN05_08705 [Roseibacillus sp.]|jgi:ABC-2 type transport system permease protein|nr:hypothetical protein [Roseibacillus sp.]MBP35816.1 hypothetical protein [Roseibacillus sp.]MDP6207968.1 ABC transporter permease subunit [Roseibacillus sp.]MDP7107671.1 ABC transporter permease subunit [Roseibacillus sp.]MDP7308382.1 ABC transporter permease subunit [Roseibacillus sp.]|tara:strand:+ start:9723 stop:10475 length:753 start_codon:yes stop_codon:yes gene_type:complete